jgi:hypothetical protein
VLVWAARSHTPWRALGYRRPERWWLTVIGGIVSGVVFKLVMKSLIMPLFGAPPINASYHFLEHNTAMLPAAIWSMLVAGFGEETVFRGYLFERGAGIVGNRPSAKMLIVVVTTALFAAAHYADQGLGGVEQAAITGLVFGTVFAITGRIFAVMIAHTAFDLTAVALIYWGLESDIAHLVFR